MLDQIVQKLIRTVTKTLYHVHITGLENIPDTGSVVLISNHQSYLDAPILYAYVKRDVKFLAWYKLFEHPFIGKILKFHHDIPIKDKDIEQIKQAFGQCCDVLNNKELLCVFPEGNLTDDGTIKEFKHGIKYLWNQCPTPIIPIAIDGFYDTIFSRKPEKKKLLKNPFKKKHIYVIIGKPMNFTYYPTPDYLRQVVLDLQKNIQHI
jgi:1-acyl-sn-glycerol-3-phosphate acyltransferase